MHTMSDAGQRFYEDDEAEQILNLAASMSSPAGQMTRERLMETAAELGITPEAVEEAEKQVMAEREDRRLRAEFDAHRRHEFYNHLSSYLIVNVIFVVMSVHAGFWAIWPILGWGIGLAVHAQATFFKGGDCYREEFQAWKARHSDQNGVVLEQATYRRTRPGMVVGIHVGTGRHRRLRRYERDSAERRERL
jgi:hypothetical protein